MFGCNDNPSAQHLESAWRKLLGQHQITATKSANCMNNDFDFLSVLNVSSRKQKEKSMTEIIENNNDIFIDEIDENDFLLPDDNFLSSFDDHIACYMASLLEKAIIDGRWYSPIKCKLCLNVFSEDELVDNDFVNLKMKSSSLNAPAKSTVEICKAAERSLKKFNYESGKYTEIVNDIFAHLNLPNLFWISNFETHPQNGHKIEIIKMIIQMYIAKKQVYLSKCNTIAQHDTFLRSKLKKLIHFKGQ